MSTTGVLILLRHGQAEPYRADDASRALVLAGREEVKRSCAFLREHAWLPQRIVASPYRRAQETAGIVQQELAPVLAIETEPMLQPDADAGLTATMLAVLAEQPLLVATHMPLVAALLRNLTGRDWGFATGALAVLRREGAQWRLAGQYSPTL
ncbi:phosphohistidine phosphatase SixA [Permianibacter sp. IMCC34836]|uniref:phosphohistidine phosphatase SixA n=1 Tax=Permianibacter fluminis TaxID=2738515 RepID=UPI001552BD39|nr:phosphohistidine phosphatase SixA [Permianibacter fluminis]NQD38159.1 phosphohistidine phosphatase SixA [Permianibacter fluminis]